MKILLLSDIHANYPALEAVARREAAARFDLVVHCGDNLVYGPHPNETLAWLHRHQALNIRGNTDRKVLRLLRGKQFKKPKKPEKRLMYAWTADHLAPGWRAYLRELPERASFEHGPWRVGVFHGSPDNPDEHLFVDTPTQRFEELARHSRWNLVLVGHSHTPFHKKVRGVHFVNPGSVGRMFDRDPRAAYATLVLHPDRLEVRLHRVEYDIEALAAALRAHLFPPIYEEMFRSGRKLN